jgi:hypothetical protein
MTVSNAKPATAQPTSKKLVVAPQPIISSPDGISNFIDQLPLEACVDLNRRLITSIPSIPMGEAHQWAFLKNVLFFVAEYGITPKVDGSGQRLAPRLQERGRCEWWKA